MKITLNKKLAIDTNILVYLLDKNSDCHEKAVELFSRFEKENTKLVVTQQCLVELVQALTDYYHKPLKAAAKIAKQVANSTIQVINPLPQTVDTYLSLCKVNTKAKSHFDLFLAATLIDNKIDQILTNDRSGFKNIKQLKVVSLE